MMPLRTVLIALTCCIRHTSSLAVPDYRRIIKKATTDATAVVTTCTTPAPALATSIKSRSNGYAVRHTQWEWADFLSGSQYNILQQGGTKLHRSSMLNSFASENMGTYVCAGCATPLFSSEDKFSSGTGWPSFEKSPKKFKRRNWILSKQSLQVEKCGVKTVGGTWVTNSTMVERNT